MPAEVRARLFPRRHEEILVRRPPRGVDVVLLILETHRARIVAAQLEMEVAQADDVEAAARIAIRSWNGVSSDPDAR